MVLDLPGLIFINQQCGNLKVVVDGGELTRNIKRKKKQTFYKPIDVDSLKNSIGKIEVSMIFLVVTFLCG